MQVAINAENLDSRDRLKKLIGSLSEAEMISRLDKGWTAALLFAHLAFWDQRILFLFKMLDPKNLIATLKPASMPPWAIDSLNEAVRQISISIPPAQAARLALESADAVDRMLETLPAELTQAILSAGMERLLRRSLHRNHHLEQMARALGKTLV